MSFRKIENPYIFRANIKKKLNEKLNNEKAIGTHYNLPGHQKAYFKVQVIERVIPNTKFYRRESFWIKKLDKINPRGLNVHN